MQARCRVSRTSSRRDSRKELANEAVKKRENPRGTAPLKVGSRDSVGEEEEERSASGRPSARDEEASDDAEESVGESGGEIPRRVTGSTSEGAFASHRINHRNERNAEQRRVSE